jgi:hypothetical protein
VPPCHGRSQRSFEVERVAGRRRRAVASRESTPSVLTRGLTHRPTSAIGGGTNRPSQERPRARGYSILLPTHFSGADEVRDGHGGR